MLFSNKNCSHAYAFHMSSHRAALCGHMLAYLCIHLLSLRLDYFLCSHVHAPHIPLHSNIICSHLPYVYAFYMSALCLIVHSLLVPLLSSKPWYFDMCEWFPYLACIFSYPCPLQISISFFFSLVYCTVDYVTWLVQQPKRVGYDYAFLCFNYFGGYSYNN